jgi:hypothetical protein
MKLLRSEKELLKEIDKLIDRVDKKMEKYDRIDREQFNQVLAYLVGQISKNRGIPREKITAKTREVIAALTDYIKIIPEEERDWSSIVTFLYIQYHQELGLINEQQILNSLSGLIE